MHRRKLEHAKWRVEFTRSLLEMQHHLPFHTPQRDSKEAALIARLKAAEEELARVKAEKGGR